MFSLFMPAPLELFFLVCREPDQDRAAQGVVIMMLLTNDEHVLSDIIIYFQVDSN